MVSAYQNGSVRKWKKGLVTFQNTWFITEILALVWNCPWSCPSGIILKRKLEGRNAYVFLVIFYFYLSEICGNNLTKRMINVCWKNYGGIILVGGNFQEILSWSGRNIISQCSANLHLFKIFSDTSQKRNIHMLKIILQKLVFRGDSFSEIFKRKLKEKDEHFGV